MAPEEENQIYGIEITEPGRRAAPRFDFSFDSPERLSEEKRRGTQSDSGNDVGKTERRGKRAGRRERRGGGGAWFLFVRGMFFPPVARNAFLLLRETLFPAVGNGSLLPSGGKCIKIETKQIRDGEEVRR